MAGNKRVATVNPYQIGVGNHGGRDILIVNEAGLHRCTGGVAFRKVAVVMMTSYQDCWYQVC